jgi:hypothetical protein
VTLQVIGAAGATADICFVTRFTGATSQEGTASPAADVGGDPFATPGGVFLNGNPLSSFMRHFAANEADSGNERGVATVTVGDMILLATGANSQTTLNGAGSTRAEALAFAAIYLGACPLQRAPAASPFGLAGLAAVLAALGALALGWRARSAR